MKPLLAFALVFLSAVHSILAAVDSAWLAREKLGEGVWSEVVQIKNVNAHSVFPSTVFATIFEFDDVLWFYEENSGTQSLSLYRGQLERDKRDLLPLLREIERGFSTVEVMSRYSRPALSAHGHLSNGCFIDSLVALREVTRNDVVQRAALLSYYINVSGRVKGHTVLVYETASGLFAMDSAWMKKPVHLDRVAWAGEPMQVACEVSSIRPDKARWLPIKLDRHVAPPNAAIVARAHDETPHATPALRPIQAG